MKPPSSAEGLARGSPARRRSRTGRRASSAAVSTGSPCPPTQAKPATWTTLPARVQERRRVEQAQARHRDPDGLVVERRRRARVDGAVADDRVRVQEDEDVAARDRARPRCTRPRSRGCRPGETTRTNGRAAARCDLVVERAVVHDDRLDVLVLPGERVEAAGERRAGPVGDDDDRDSRARGARSSREAGRRGPRRGGRARSPLRAGACSRLQGAVSAADSRAMSTHAPARRARELGPRRPSSAPSRPRRTRARRRLCGPPSSCPSSSPSPRSLPRARSRPLHATPGRLHGRAPPPKLAQSLAAGDWLSIRGEIVVLPRPPPGALRRRPRGSSATSDDRLRGREDPERPRHERGRLPRLLARAAARPALVRAARGGGDRRRAGAPLQRLPPVGGARLPGLPARVRGARPRARPARPPAGAPRRSASRSSRSGRASSSSRSRSSSRSCSLGGGTLRRHALALVGLAVLAARRARRRHGAARDVLRARSGSTSTVAGSCAGPAATAALLPFARRLARRPRRAPRARAASPRGRARGAEAAFARLDARRRRALPRPGRARSPPASRSARSSAT